MTTPDNNNSKWTEDDVDQMLTSFFRDEMPTEIRALPESQPVSSTRVVPTRTASDVPLLHRVISVAVALVAVIAFGVTLATRDNDQAGNDVAEDPVPAVPDDSGAVERRGMDPKVQVGTNRDDQDDDEGMQINLDPSTDIQLHDDEESDEDKKESQRERSNSSDAPSDAATK